MSPTTTSEDVARILDLYSEIIKQNSNCYVIITGSMLDSLPGDYSAMRDSSITPLTKLEKAGFVPCSMKTGKNLDGILRQILEWGVVISGSFRSCPPSPARRPTPGPPGCGTSCNID